jgi:hypothetical protein
MIPALKGTVNLRGLEIWGPLNSGEQKSRQPRRLLIRAGPSLCAAPGSLCKAVKAWLIGFDAHGNCDAGQPFALRLGAVDAQSMLLPN